MKICPKCGKTYSDASLNFCLDDGTVLSQPGPTFDSSLPETVMINQPRQTFAERPLVNQTEQQAFAVPTQTVAQKGSRAWLWVVGILGGVILLCGGGMAGLLMLGSMAEEEPKWNSNFGTNTAYNGSTKDNSSTVNTANSAASVSKIDLAAWVRDSSQYGKTEYRGSELFMNAIRDNYYYVLVAPASYKSSNATTKITLRNPDGGENTLGYGLIVNSNPVPLIRDYAFLINTKTSKYRVVSHSPGKEQTVVNWKNSAAIRSGSQENVLEVQDQGGQFKFFINGELVETLSSSASFKDGVPGIYVGGKSPIAFSNLEIRK